MKRVLIYILLALAAVLTPVERSDLGKLKPVEVIYLGEYGERVVIYTDTEDMGSGTALEAAIENLKETTSGTIYLDTADYLLVAPGGEKWVSDIACHIKASAYVCTAEAGMDIRKAATFLSVHTPQCRLKDWEKEGILQKLTMENSRYRLE